MDSTNVIDPISINLSSGSPTKGGSIPTTPTSIGKKFALARYRYGREDMLALLPDRPSRPSFHPDSGNILSDETLQPLALVPMAEEEQKILSGPVNSYSAFKRAPPTALSMRGRGGRAPRGRGRGEGHYARSHSTSEDSSGGEWTTYYGGGGRGATTPGWSPSWEGGPSFKHSRGDQDSNWRSGGKDGEGKWVTPASPGGPQRSGSWKSKENKDNWLPGWAQNSKDGRINGQQQQQQQEKQEDTQVKGEKVKEDFILEDEVSKPPDQKPSKPRPPQPSSSPWGTGNPTLAPTPTSTVTNEQVSSITPDANNRPQNVQDVSNQDSELTASGSSDHSERVGKQQQYKQQQQQQQQHELHQQQLPPLQIPPSEHLKPVSSKAPMSMPSPVVDVFPSAIGSKEAAPLVPPTTLSHQGLAGIFSTPNFTPSFGMGISPDSVDMDMANRFEKAAEDLLSTEDDDTPTSTPLTLKGSTNPPFDASSSPVIGPKETAVDTPMSVADLSNNHAPKPSSMLPQTHPSLDQHGLPQDMLQSVQYPPQTSYSEEDFHRWFYKDPQGVMQGPFPSCDMKEWFDEGYFTLDLMVRRACDEMMLPLGQVIRLWGFIPFVEGQKPPPPVRASEQYWSNLFSQQSMLFRHQQAYLLQAQAVAQAQAQQAQTRALTQHLLVQQTQQPQQQQQQEQTVASTSLSQQTAPSHTSPHQPVPSQPSPRQPAPSQPSPRQPAPSQPTARQPAPSQSIPRQPTPSQPLPRQPQAPSVENVPRSTAQTSQRKEPDPTKPEPSTQWPEFTNVWESSESSEDEDSSEEEREMERRRQAEEQERIKRQKAEEEKRRLEVEKRKAELERQEEEKKRKKAEEKRQEALRKQMQEAEEEDDDAFLFGAEDNGGMKDLSGFHHIQQQQQLEQQQAWFEEQSRWFEEKKQQQQQQLANRVPWTATSVASMGTRSLLEIQQEEAKEVEQQRVLADQRRSEVLAEKQQQNKSWGSTTVVKKSTPTGSTKSFAEIQKEQEEAMKRATTNITQSKRPQQQQQPSAIPFASPWTSSSPSYRPTPGWSVSSEVPSNVSAQIKQQSASFWEEVGREPLKEPSVEKKASAKPQATSVPKAKKEVRKPSPVAAKEESWKPTEEFIVWCEDELGKFEQRADSTVFLEYLQGCDTAEEIQGMIMTLFEEEASKAREFATRFIEKRQKMIDGVRMSESTTSSHRSVSHSKQSQGRQSYPPRGHTSTSGGGGGGKSANNKKTKKAKKGQKLDPFMLGFSVHAAERPNIGEIQSVNDVHK